jgi:hypothetical protein
MPRIPFALQSYQHPEMPLSAQRVLNMYAEAQPQDAKARTPLLFTPGLTTFATCGDGPIRGMRFYQDRLIVVSGGQVWQVTRDGTANALGSAPGSGPVRMDDNGDWLAIVDAPSSELRLLRLETVSTVIDTDFPGAVDVGTVGGYFAYISADRKNWFLSDLEDPTNYDALAFASAEARPDPLVALAIVGLNVWLLGTKTVEVWDNTGRNTFPFERAPGGVIQRGCQAQFSVQVLASRVHWLGDDGVVYRAANSQLERISTHALEQSWALLGDLSTAEATVYESGGHQFYALTIGGRTFVYDGATGLWHERQSRGQTRWRVGNVAQGWNAALYAGDFVNGMVWRLDPDARTDGGDAIEREAVGAPLHGDGARMTMSRVTLEMNTGRAPVTGQGSTPQAMLDWSDDGGRTWSNEHWRNIGAIGNYRRRVEWRRLGQFRERSLRLRITDPIATAVLAVQIDAEAGGV